MFCSGVPYNNNANNTELPIPITRWGCILSLALLFYLYAFQQILIPGDFVEGSMQLSWQHGESSSPLFYFLKNHAWEVNLHLCIKKEKK